MGSGKSPQKGQKGGVHLGRDLRGLARAKRVRCLQSWTRMVVVGTRSVLLTRKRVLGGAEDENSGVLVLNCILPQLDSLVVGDSLRHDCCSSDASSDANEEKFDSDALENVVDDRLSVDVAF